MLGDVGTLFYYAMGWYEYRDLEFSRNKVFVVGINSEQLRGTSRYPFQNIFIHFFSPPSLSLYISSLGLSVFQTPDSIWRAL